MLVIKKGGFFFAAADPVFMAALKENNQFTYLD